MKIFVKAKPLAKEEKVKKIDETHFIVAVKEPPVQGHANAAIIKALADFLNIAPARLRISAGYASRQKIIELLTAIFSKKRLPLKIPTPPRRVILTPPPPDQPPTPTPPPIEPTVSESAMLPTQNSKQPNILENTGFSISAEQLKQIIPTLSDSKYKEHLPCLLQTMNEFEINTPLRVAAFIAQTAHESVGYSAFLENLNYSAQALLKTWPNRFTPESAATYARQPEKIANRVYINRLGNGDEASGDGWCYRGRGVIQTTGRINYKTCGVGLGLDLITSPELLEQPLNAFRSAG